ncbi:MAG: NAD(P)/FAD-dependent oxidoreductase, partial [Raoultibacter sp.]
LFPDGRHLVVDPSLDQTCENIAQFSDHDAEAYRKFNTHFTKMLAVAGIGSQSAPPPYGMMHAAMYASPEGREFQRVLVTSAQDICEEWFESPEVRMTLTRWCTEMMIDPRQIGTSALLYFTGTVHDPANLGSPFPKGGCVTFVKALTDCCTDMGADLFAGDPVNEVALENGEAKYVRTEGGLEYVADNAVISTINIKQLYDFMGDAAPEKEAYAIDKLKFADFSAFNMSYALKKEPIFKCGEDIKKAFDIEVAPATEKEYLNTFSSFTLGETTTKMPCINMPCLLDPTRVPGSGCVVNIYNYAPYALYGDPKNWATHKDEMQQEIWEYTKSFWTNITDDDIIGSWCMSPTDYEEWDKSMIHGDIGQIGLQPSQYYDMRPLVGRGHEYHGEIENLYFLGSCSHPGGGIAASARSGVQRVLEDYGIDFLEVVK